MYSFLTLSIWVYFTCASSLPLLFLIHSLLWPILLLGGVFGIAFIIRGKRKSSTVQIETLPGSPLNYREVVEFSRYAGGHPDIHDHVRPCLINFKPGLIQISRYLNTASNQIEDIAIIPADSIVEIRVEDVFTMKRKMTPENWKVSYKYFSDLNDANGDEIAFIVIEWIKDAAHQYTYLCIQDDLAMEIAVKKRNAIIKKSKKGSLQSA